MRRRIRGKKPYKAKPFNQKEGATKETKLCLPLTPPDQAFNDTVSLIVMYNVETKPSLLLACPTPSLITNTRSPSPHTPYPQTKRWLQVSFMVISLISRTQHILIIPKLKHDFSHFDLVRMSSG